MDETDETLIAALLELRQHAEQFRKARTRTAMIDERRPRAVRSGPEPTGASEVPMVTQSTPEEPDPSWFRPFLADEDREQVALDEHGRPLWSQSDYDVTTCWTWSSDIDEELSIRTKGRGNRTTGRRTVRDGAGTTIGTVSCEGDRSTVRRWRRDAEGRVPRSERAGATVGGGWEASAAEATFDDEGRVDRVRHSARDLDRDTADTPPLEEGGLEDALRRALSLAATLECTTVAWDARWQRAERLRPDDAELSTSIADGLVRALRAATRAAGLRRTACVEVPGSTDIHRALPPWILVADEEWQRGLQRRRPKPEAVPRLLDDARRAGTVPALDLVPFADEATLRACREVETALHHRAPREDQHRATAILTEVGELLGAALVDPEVVPDPLPAFLAVVSLGEEVGGGLARARRHAGDDAVDRFLGITADAPVVPRPSAAYAELARRAAAELDRGALRDLAAAIGLEKHADHLADELAKVALVGLRSDDPDVRSRVGGPALLPPGVPWPRFDDRRPLSFVAAIDLSEVPAIEHPRRWPREGWLLVFADIDGEPEGDDIALYEVEDNGERSAARVLVVPAGRQPEPASPPPTGTPDRPSEVESTAVTWWPRLMLPRDPPERSGLDPFAAGAYGELCGELDEILAPGEDEQAWSPQLWLQGHATDPGEGTDLLLHLEDGWSPGLHLLTSALEVHLPHDAFEAWDLSRARIRTEVL